MTDRSAPAALTRAPVTLQGLLDRMTTADLDPVQIASMHLHLSHLLRVRTDWASAKASLAGAVPGMVQVEVREAENR